MRYEHYHNCIKFSKINNIYVYERTQGNKASFYLTVQIKGAHVDGRGLLYQLESRKRAALTLFTFTPSLHEARKVELQRVISCCSHISPLWKEDVNSVPLCIRSM